MTQEDSTGHSLLDQILAESGKRSSVSADKDPLNMVDALLRENFRVKAHGDTYHIEGRGTTLLALELSRQPDKILAVITPFSSDDKAVVEISRKTPDGPITVSAELTGRSFWGSDAQDRREAANTLIPAVDNLVKDLPITGGKGLVNTTTLRGQPVTLSTEKLEAAFETRLEELIRAKASVESSAAAAAKERAAPENPDAKTVEMLDQVEGLLRYSQSGGFIDAGRSKANVKFHRDPGRLIVSLTPILDRSPQLDITIKDKKGKLTVTQNMSGGGYTDKGECDLASGASRLFMRLPIVPPEGERDVFFRGKEGTIDPEVLAQKIADWKPPIKKTAVAPPAAPELTPDQRRQQQSQQIVAELLKVNYEREQDDKIAKLPDEAKEMLSKLAGALSGKSPFVGKNLRPGEVPPEGVTMGDMAVTRYGTGEISKIMVQLAESEQRAAAKLLDEILHGMAHPGGHAADTYRGPSQGTSARGGGS